MIAFPNPLGRTITALTLMALPSPALAQIRAGSCVERPELEAMIVASLPPIAVGLSRKCTPVLPAGAPLRNGQALAARYKADADRAWPAARAAFAKVSEMELPSFLDPSTLQTVAGEVVAGAVVGGIPTSDCALIDRAAAALAPLPGRNVGQLAVVAFEAAQARREDLPFTLCDTSRAPAR